MGTVFHDAIIITSWDKEAIAAAVEKAADLGLPVTGPVRSEVNCYLTLFVQPDGSKLGWADRKASESKRISFEFWLRTAFIHEDGSGPFEWVAVRYGSDHAGEVGSAVVTGSSR